jgi:hypothetical protein
MFGILRALNARNCYSGTLEHFIHVETPETLEILEYWGARNSETPDWECWEHSECQPQ